MGITPLPPDKRDNAVGAVRAADPSRPIRAEKLFMRLDNHIAKFRGDRLTMTLTSCQRIELRLAIGDYQRRFVEAQLAEGRRDRISGHYVLVPFRKAVDLTEAYGWIALDVNETNVTGVGAEPHVYR